MCLGNYGHNVVDSTTHTQARKSQIVPVRRHLILRSSFKTEDHIHIISEDALSACWAPTIARDALPLRDAGGYTVVCVDDIPKLRTFVGDADVQPAGLMFVYESPLQDDCYRVWIHDESIQYNVGGSLRCYQLSIPTLGPPRCRLNRVSKVLDIVQHTIPYSGHIFRPGSRDDLVDSILLPNSSTRVDMPFHAEFPDLMAYSGVLTSATDSAIVIRYFK
jgi:hypothetical protein